MAKTSMSLDTDIGEPMFASELREFLEKVPDDAVIVSDLGDIRYATYKSDEGTLEVG